MHMNMELTFSQTEKTINNVKFIQEKRQIKENNFKIMKKLTTLYNKSGANSMHIP